MQKLPDYKMLEMAYDYQYNKDDFINAGIWLHKLLKEYPHSEYINIAQKRLSEIRLPSWLIENEICKIESDEKNKLEKIKESIPLKISELVKKYEWKIIKINYKEAFNFADAFLIKISNEFISILLHGGVVCHYPFNYIMSIAEGKDPEGKDILVLQICHQTKPVIQGTGGPVIGVGVLFDLFSLFNHD
jgi:hypothetical protein